jgi:predicted nucleic acid-binding protein
VPIDLLPEITGGLLTRCDCESDEETDLYVELAARIGDDGESMGLAIAKCRGWSVLTDDKKARRIATELGVTVLSTTEVLKQWSENSKPTDSQLSAVLEAIERFANYTPGRGAAYYEWWIASLKTRKE